MTTDLHQQLAEAGRARGQAMAARADRPKERRSADGWAWRAGSGARAWPAVPGIRSRISIRDSSGGSGSATFDGMATVYDEGYQMYDFWGPYTEVVEAGAGSESLNRADLDVPLVLQHDQLRRIARTTNGSLQLTETDEGLHVLAPDLDLGDADVAYIVPKLRATLIDEMSFAFRITQGQWSPDFEQFVIKAYDIHRGDVAIVGFGANPATAGSGLREQKQPDRAERARVAALLAFAAA